MKLLNSLADGLSQEDRDAWVSRVSSLDTRLSEEDEMRFIMDAIGLLSRANEKKLQTVIEQFESRTEVISADDIEKIIRESVSLPSFQELRTYLMDAKTLNETIEMRQSKETKSLQEIERILRELKSTNGRAFLILLASIISGAFAGLLTHYLPEIITKLL